MRAVASNEPARDFRRQSQCTARRLDSEDFHPLPPQIGQTSAATFMNSLCFQCALGERVCASAQTWDGCAQPVELWKVCGEPGTLLGTNSDFLRSAHTKIIFYFFWPVVVSPDRALPAGTTGPARVAGDGADE